MLISNFFSFTFLICILFFSKQKQRCHKNATISYLNTKNRQHCRELDDVWKVKKIPVRHLPRPNAQQASKLKEKFQLYLYTEPHLATSA